MERAETWPKRQAPPGREQLRQQLEARIRKAERASGHGLLGMVLFLLVSFAAFDGFALLPDLPDPIRRLLGTPPPAEMISLALVVYAFSGVVYNLARMTRERQSFRGLMHAAFFTAFYAFYHLSGALADNVWAVFFAGLGVLGLENYMLWSQSGSAVRRDRQRLEQLERGLPVEMEDEEVEED